VVCEALLRKNYKIMAKKRTGSSQHKVALRWWRPHLSGLQRQMALSYVLLTVVAAFLLLCLYAGLLSIHLNYVLAREASVSPALIASYPWQGAVVMLGVALLGAPLLGGFFGIVATRRLVQRIHTLAQATAEVADGRYSSRVQVSGKDEIGQLEEHFNEMAQQLAESLMRQQELAASNGRIAERTRLARELHDAISQNLFSLRMQAYGLKTVLPADQTFQVPLERLEQTISDTILEMRAMLLEMRPTSLERLGLAEALKELAASYSDRVGVTMTTEITEHSPTAEVEHTLFRIAQEALSNAVRHGRATMITLRLVPQVDTVTLTIEDNGKGFSMEETNVQHGLGLRLMQERVQDLRGSFSLESSLDQGTCIKVCIPVDRAG
jgi:two-component system, NarL family, sensor histidine kinase LiaS